jgi:hypothetical protein
MENINGLKINYEIIQLKGTMITPPPSYHELLSINQHLRNELNRRSSQKDITISQLQATIVETTERLAERDFHLHPLQTVLTEFTDGYMDQRPTILTRRLRQTTERLREKELQITYLLETLQMTANLIHEKHNPDAILASLDKVLSEVGSLLPEESLRRAASARTAVKIVRRRSLDRLNASMIKQKKHSHISPCAPHVLCQRT